MGTVYEYSHNPRVKTIINIETIYVDILGSWNYSGSYQENYSTGVVSSGTSYTTNVNSSTKYIVADETWTIKKQQLVT